MLGKNCFQFGQGDNKKKIKTSILVHARTESEKICFPLYFYTQLAIHGSNVEQPKGK